MNVFPLSVLVSPYVLMRTGGIVLFLAGLGVLLWGLIEYMRGMSVLIPAERDHPEDQNDEDVAVAEFEIKEIKWLTITGAALLVFGLVLSLLPLILRII